MTTMGEVHGFEFRCPPCDIGFGKDAEAFKKHVEENHPDVWSKWKEEGTV